MGLLAINIEGGGCGDIQMENQEQAHWTGNRRRDGEWVGIHLNRAKGKGGAKRCNTVWDMLWVSGDEGG